MKIEELIQLHNDTLNRKVEDHVYLNQRIKAHLRNRKVSKSHSPWLPLKKSILIYSFLLILFTILNFMIIDGLKKQNTTLKPTQQLISTIDAFSPSYPGSISQAFTEVMK